MKIAITAASGQLGQLTLNKLLEKGHEPANIIAIARTTAKLADFAAKGVNVREGDYEDIDALTKALDGADRLLLISSGAGIGERFGHHANAVQAAKTAGVKLLAYTSVVNADTAKNYPFAPEHAQTERMIADSGISAAILRNGSYNEFYTDFLAGLYQQLGAVIDASQGGKLSAAAKPDLAEAAAALLMKEAPEARIYELAGEDFTLADIAEAINTKTGAQIERRPINDEEYVATLVSAGFNPGFAPLFLAHDLAIAGGELRHDSDDLEKLLGRKPMSIQESFQS